jgi:hypothetical protein
MSGFKDGAAVWAKPQYETFERLTLSHAETVSSFFTVT